MLDIAALKRTLDGPEPSAPTPFARVFGPDLSQQIPDADSRWGYRGQYSEITFPRLTSILGNADRGYTDEWAELSRRMLRSDSHLASVYETRLVGVAGARWEVAPGEGGDPKLAQRAAEDCTRMLEQLPDLEQFFTMVLDGIGVGYSVHEIYWKVIAGRVMPWKLEWIHPRRFRFDVHYDIYVWDDSRAWGYSPEDQRFSDAGSVGMALKPNKYVVHIPRVVPDYAPMSGLLMTVARQWWVKQIATKYALMGAELAANPRAMAKVPQAATQTAMDQLRTQLERMAVDGILVVKGDVDILLQAPLAEGSVRAWGDLIDRMSAEESKGIVGSTLNVEVTSGGGNRALGESQFDSTTLPRAARDGRSMWTTIQRDLFRSFLWFNRALYGGVMPPIPRGRFILEEDPVSIDDLAVKSRTVTKDEMRTSRGLAPWGKERGGDDLIDAIDGPAPGAAQLPGQAGADPTVEKAADSAFTGVQSAQLDVYVQNYATGKYPFQAVVEMILIAFPSIPRERCEAMLHAITPGSLTPDGLPTGAVPTAPTPPTPASATPPAAPVTPAAAPPITTPGGAASALPFSERTSGSTTMPWDLAKAAASRASQGASPTSSPSPKRTRAERAPAPRSVALADPKSSRSTQRTPDSQLGLPFSPSSPKP